MTRLLTTSCHLLNMKSPKKVENSFLLKKDAEKNATVSFPDFE